MPLREFSSQPRLPLPGSERTPLPGARPIADIDPNERIEVSVYLKAPSSSQGASASEQTASAPRQRMTREEFAASQGAAPEALATIEAFAHEYNLTLVEKNAARRVVILAGPASAMRAAFGVELHRYEHPGGTYRGRKDAITLPEQIAPLVDAVVGLDDRPQAVPHFRYHEAAAATAYTPPQLATLYDFPPGTGAGQCIAFIELGGGYQWQDLQTYFTQLRLALPPVSSVSVDGGHNSPTGNPLSADGEVALDLEVAGAIAPDARLVVYFAPNTDRGFLDAITQAIHDTNNRPSVISISWGGQKLSGPTRRCM